MFLITTTALWTILTGLLIEFVFRLFNSFSKEMRELFGNIYSVCGAVIIIMLVVYEWNTLIELLQNTEALLAIFLVLVTDVIVSLLINKKPPRVETDKKPLDEE
jgi:hypothetical protein